MWYTRSLPRFLKKRLKPVLSPAISSEQFGFLDGCQIHEAIGIVKQGLHAIQEKNKPSFIIKLDLSKAYPKVSWDYLRLMMILLDN
jgi:hypothetical protein